MKEEETYWLEVALVYQNIANMTTALGRTPGEEMSDERRASLLEAKNAERARNLLAVEPGHRSLDELLPSSTGTAS